MDTKAPLWTNSPGSPGVHCDPSSLSTSTSALGIALPIEFGRLIHFLWR